MSQAKDLLKRYGSAYLITSISFALVSMTACYLAVDAGLDVAGLLARFGLQVRCVGHCMQQAFAGRTLAAVDSHCCAVAGNHCWQRLSASAAAPQLLPHLITSPTD